MADSLFVKILSIPKSFYVSGRLVGWKHAYKLPVFVRYNCVLNNLSGRVEMEGNRIKKRMLYIGFSNTGIFDTKFWRSVLEIAGKLVVDETAGFGQGTKLSIASTGVMSLGRNFSSPAEGTFVCVNKIHIGQGTAIGWSALIMDSDWHSVMNPGTCQLFQAAGEVYIGDHCWIGTRSVVLKDTYIPDGCILAANSTATGHFTKANTL